MPAALTWGPHLWDEDPNGCWLWNRSKVKNGTRGVYKGRLAHRVALERSLGLVLTPEQQALHHCDVTLCVRPDHLYVGDHDQNMADKVARRRHQYHDATHCEAGHEYTPENTYLTKQGWKKCRSCGREYMRQYRERTRTR